MGLLRFYLHRGLGSGSKAPAIYLLSVLKEFFIRAFKIIFALGIAVIAAEFFVRLLIPSIILFGTWYSDGAYTPDAKYGFVPTPNYRGVMSHSDAVYEVPLSLDENGFRTFSTSRNSNDHPREIVLMGGASMMFGYGTSTDKTIGGYLAKSLSYPSTVYTTSFPGLDLNRNFFLYEEKLASRVNPSHIIIGIYFHDKDAAAWDHLKDGFKLQKPPSYESLFGLFKGRITFPLGTIGKVLGIWNYRSALLNRTVRFVDNWAPEDVKTKIASFAGIFMPSPAGEKTITSSHSTTAENDYSAFTTYIKYLNNLYANRGQKVLVVMLPLQGALGTDTYKNIRNSIPNEVAKLDLHKEMMPILLECGDKCWLGAGHYSPGTNQAIAEKLSSWIESNASSVLSSSR